MEAVLQLLLKLIQHYPRMSRITTQELQNDVVKLHNTNEQVFKPHLIHMMEDIDELKEAVADNRNFFMNRLDRLDNKIFWILGMVITTLVTIVASIVTSNM